MDKAALRLAREGARIYREIHSPDYRDVQAELAGRLSMGAVQMENLQQEEAARLRNLKLVENFVNTLPRMESKSDGHDSVHGFYTLDRYIARQIEANILNVHGDPYYLIGEKGDTSGKYTDPKRPATNLLLIGAGFSTSLEVATVWEDQWQAAQYLARKDADKPYTTEQLERLRVSGSDELCVPRTTGIQTHWSFLYALKNENQLQPPPRRTSAEQVVTTQGMEYVDERLRGPGIADEIMDGFDVFTHLHQLATVFGKEIEWIQLLEQAEREAPDAE